MKRLSSIAFLALLFGSLPISPAPAAEAPGCPSGLWSSIYPDQCILEYSDEATSTKIGATTYRLQPDLDSCSEYFAGVKVRTGYDRFSYVRLSNVPTSGEIKGNQLVEVEVSVSENCRAWTKSYLLSGRIILQDGKEIPFSLSESGFRYREKFTGSIDSYCFINICATATFSGQVKVDSSAKGPVTLRIDTTYNSNSATGIQLSSINATYKYANSLYIGSPTPIAPPTPSSQSNVIDQSIPLTKVTAISGDDGIISCYVQDFTKEAVDTYQIVGTRWRVSTNNLNMGATVLDEYDWGLGVQTNGDMIREYTSNGGKISLITGGIVIYSYVPRNQVKGSGYECSVAIRTKNGLGRYASEIVFSKIDSKEFTPVVLNQEADQSPTTMVSPKAKTAGKQVTISCIKGKVVKKVTGPNAKCPKGFKRK